MPSSAPAEVGDRLERLAEQAPRRLDDPDLLWSRGRRRQRRGWVGTAAGLVVLAVLGAVTVPATMQRVQVTPAASPDAALSLPDLVRQPGEWEGAFPETPGRLVAVGLGTRDSWWSSRSAWWGVSAMSGESRFLDLPDAYVESGARPALSADGRRLAYWFTGETTQDAVSDVGGAPVIGVAVLDLTTGEEVRWDTGSPRGMMTDGLAWAGDVLWWAGGPYEEAGEASFIARVNLHTWDVSTDERQDLGRVGAARRRSLDSAGPAPEGFIARGRRGVLRLVQDEREVRTVRLDADLEAQQFTPPTLSPGGTTVAGLMEHEPSGGGEPSPLVVGDLGETTTEMDPVADIETTAVLGWRSDDEVVIETHTGGEFDRVYGASVVDIATGEVTPLLDFRGNVPYFAYDAWSADVVEAPDAPWVPDPRLVAVAVLVGAYVVLKAGKLVRRRRVGT